MDPNARPECPSIRLSRPNTPISNPNEDDSGSDTERKLGITRYNEAHQNHSNEGIPTHDGFS